jgi:cyclopropane-fatty-acyl-phospholipid synthase
MGYFSDTNQLRAAKRLFSYLGEKIDNHFSVRLWDGTMIPLGKNAGTDYFFAINDPGVLGSLLRKPTYENFLSLYANGYIDVHGDLIDLVTLARKQRKKGIGRSIKKGFLIKQLLPFLFTSLGDTGVSHRYGDDEVGRKERHRDNKEFIQFHYDISNDFYSLFLGKEMQYSCGYFTREDNTIDQAQHDKLEMICRKLRLKSGERFLDIGCGWGGLICHAARHFGVIAHGVTLSQEQFDFATAKVKRLGLEDRITIELRDYSSLKGTYDKIASIGMFEHIGIANMQRYFRKINSLLSEHGLVLNHGISRRAKASKSAIRKIRPERRLLLKYIFPGSELDNAGHTIDMMEICGFEVHDLEAWREHYGFTTREWYRALMANKEEALTHVSEEIFRMWAIYLAGTSLGFANGGIHIVQVLASKKSKGPSGLPLTRADLYR